MATHFGNFVKNHTSWNSYRESGANMSVGRPCPVEAFVENRLRRQYSFRCLRICRDSVLSSFRREAPNNVFCSALEKYSRQRIKSFRIRNCGESKDTEVLYRRRNDFRNIELLEKERMILACMVILLAIVPEWGIENLKG